MLPTHTAMGKVIEVPVSRWTGSRDDQLIEHARAEIYTIKHSQKLGLITAVERDRRVKMVLKKYGFFGKQNV